MNRIRYYKNEWIEWGIKRMNEWNEVLRVWMNRIWYRENGWMAWVIKRMNEWNEVLREWMNAWIEWGNKGMNK